MTHGIFAVTLARVVIREPQPLRFWLLVGGLAMVPDLDVIGLQAGIPYAACWGHRGASHSLLFAAFPALLYYFLAAGKKLECFVLYMAMASHGLLDALTDGGLGVEFFWPLSCKRYFFDFRPIAVSPIGIQPFLKDGGAALRSELIWIALPCLAILGVNWLFNRRKLMPKP
jgi:inner membrane protein